MFENESFRSAVAAGSTRLRFFLSLRLYVGGGGRILF